MKRSVNILFFLFIFISLLVLTNISAETDSEETITLPEESPTINEEIQETIDTTTEDLTDKEKETLETIRTTSEATTKLISDTTTKLWPILKDLTKNPTNASKELKEWAKIKVLRITGVTNSEGKNITLYKNNKLLVLFLIMGIFVGLLLGIIIAIHKKAQDKNILKKAFIGAIIGGLVGILLNFTNFALLKNSYFQENILFSAIVVILFTIIYFLAPFPNTLDDETWEEMFESTHKQNKTHLLTIAGFFFIYLLFETIPVLNWLTYFLTLEFLGTNNFFLFFIRPLIIAAILFFSKGLLDKYSESQINKKDFEKALEKKAIEEKNKAELKA